MFVTLWGVNRWLRFFGFRLTVMLPGEDGITRVGIIWGGLPGSARWRRWER